MVTNKWHTGGPFQLVMIAMSVAVAAVGATGMIITTTVVNVSEEASVRIRVIFDSAHIAAWFLNRVLAGHMFTCRIKGFFYYAIVTGVALVYTVVIPKVRLVIIIHIITH